MIELVSIDGPNDARFIGDRRKLRQQFTDPLAGFAMLLKRKLPGQHFGNASNEGESFAFEVLFRALLVVKLLQLRLVFKQLQLRWRTSHVQIDY